MKVDIKKSTKKGKKFMAIFDCDGNIKTIHFGAEGMSDFTKHKDPKRRANFRARHNCATAKDKTTARYWACKHLW